MHWLQEQLKKLECENSRYNEDIAVIKSVDSQVCNEFFEWTPLKLAFLHYVLAIYSAIIPKYFNHMYYVDLFAGSGINKTKKGKYYLIGSPFIATLNYRNKYDKFFFCETKKEYAKTLNDRLDSIKIQNKKVFSEDCNEALNDILLELSEVQNRHILFFIDPFSLEFKWESMIKVLALRSDIVFVFMTSQIVRAWKGALAQPEHLTKVLDTFYGDQSWKNAECEGDLLTIYKNKIQMARSECVLESVEIKGKGFHYEVIFITHKTKQDNPWLKGILKAKKEIEHNSDQAVKVTLEVISQKQADLGRFFK